MGETPSLGGQAAGTRRRRRDCRRADDASPSGRGLRVCRSGPRTLKGHCRAGAGVAGAGRRPQRGPIRCRTRRCRTDAPGRPRRGARPAAAPLAGRQGRRGARGAALGRAWYRQEPHRPGVVRASQGRSGMRASASSARRSTPRARSPRSSSNWSGQPGSPGMMTRITNWTNCTRCSRRRSTRTGSAPLRRCSRRCSPCRPDVTRRSNLSPQKQKEKTLDAICELIVGLSSAAAAAHRVRRRALGRPHHAGGARTAGRSHRPAARAAADHLSARVRPALERGASRHHAVPEPAQPPAGCAARRAA